MAALLLLILNLVPACPAEGWVTSDYGRRVHPVSGRRSFHQGTDIGNVEGTPVRTPFPGIVRVAGWARGAGRYVVVRTGPLETRLLHLSSVAVRKGELVYAGQVVGGMGHSGSATGDHLHLVTRIKGKHVDPWFTRLRCPVSD